MMDEKFSKEIPCPEQIFIAPCIEDDKNFTNVLQLAYNDDKYGFSKNKLIKELDKYKKANSCFYFY